MGFLGYPEDSLNVLKEAEILSKELGDEQNLARIYQAFGLYYSMKGDLLLGTKYAEDCFREAEKIQDVDLMAQSAAALCSPYSWSGKHIQIVEMAPRVLTVIEKLGKESESFGFGWNLYSYLYSNYGCSLGFIGNMKEGEIFCEKGLRYAEKTRDLIALGMCELYYGLYYSIKGDGKPVIEHFQNSIKYFKEANFPFVLGLSWGGLGIGYYLIGDLKTAQMHIEKGLHIQKKESGAAALLSFYYLRLSSVHFDLQDLKKAQDCAEKALKLSLNNNERHIEGISRGLLGWILGKKDPSQYGKAEKYILHGIKILEELKLKPYLSRLYQLLGGLYADTGQREKSLINLKKAEEMFKEMGMDYYLAKTQEVLKKL
jgi:tetratricopeptide (TPR) repeat protein